MPNIVVVGLLPQNGGFLSASLRKPITEQITEIVTGLGISADEGVITFLDNSKCVAMAADQGPQPYLVVRDTEPERAMKIASALNTALKIDVEVHLLNEFLARPE